MSKPLRPKRGTTAENDTFTGLPYEVTLDTDTHRLRTHDGTTAGGYEHALMNDIPGVMTGATESAPGTSGNVPAPQAGEQNRPLRGDGTWATSLTCNITGNCSGSSGSCTGNAATATKATGDESGNNIKSSYAASLSVSGSTITLKNKNGAVLSTQSIGGAGADAYIVETWSSGTSFYRKWSDGWIEQGGKTASGSTITVTLNTPFKTTNYVVNNTPVAASNAFGHRVTNKTTKSFQFQRIDDANCAEEWTARGY